MATIFLVVRSVMYDLIKVFSAGRLFERLLELTCSLIANNIIFMNLRKQFYVSCASLDFCEKFHVADYLGLPTFIAIVKNLHIELFYDPST